MGEFNVVVSESYAVNRRFHVVPFNAFLFILFGRIHCRSVIEHEMEPLAKAPSSESSAIAALRTARPQSARLKPTFGCGWICNIDNHTLTSSCLLMLLHSSKSSSVNQEKK